jgi:hypothetical protein
VPADYPLPVCVAKDGCLQRTCSRCSSDLFSRFVKVPPWQAGRSSERTKTTRRSSLNAGGLSPDTPVPAPRIRDGKDLCMHCATDEVGPRIFDAILTPLQNSASLLRCYIAEAIERDSLVSDLRSAYNALQRLSDSVWPRSCQIRVEFELDSPCFP